MEREDLIKYYISEGYSETEAKELVDNYLDAEEEDNLNRYTDLVRELEL